MTVKMVVVVVVVEEWYRFILMSLMNMKILE